MAEAGAAAEAHRLRTPDILEPAPILDGGLPNVAPSTALAHLLGLIRIGPTGKKPPTHVAALAALAAQHSLGVWVARYLRTEVYGLKSPHTLETKIRDLNGFMLWFVKENGHGDIHEWLPRDTAAYLASLDGKGLATTTLNRAFATLRRFAKWAHEEPGIWGQHSGSTNVCVKR